ncbi:metallophosphoesterase [Ferruginibacter sp.]
MITETNKTEKFAEFDALLAQNLQASSILGDLMSRLEYAEYELINLMWNAGVWTGTPEPPAPAGYTPGSGNVDFALFLYWFNHPGDIKGLDWELEALIYYLQYKQYIAPTQMTLANYNFFSSNELIYEDGSVLSMETWATYDQGWFTAFLNLLETLIRKLWYNGGTFPATTPPVITLQGAAQNRVSIAVIGDWGTGDAVATGIMSQITSMKQAPDYIFHVGDVYYGGTPSTNASHYFSPGEEVANLLNVWPAAYNGKSFTLNSNHEMYSGANGYFNDALGASQTPPASNTPFSAQKGSSCFALQFGGWTLLGLDSAFTGTSLDAFMSGSIGGATGTQGKWISSLGLDPAKTIVLTHHDGFAVDCSAVNPLWMEIRGALGNKDPFAWYWGHVHNGIVYGNSITIKDFTTNTLARCLGHGALPYGFANNLSNVSQIAWLTNSPKPAPSKELLNGFAVIDLVTQNNVVVSITESFYVLGNLNPVYTKPIFGA